MKIESYLFLALFLIIDIPVVNAAVTINEIMSHKNNLWNGEWVELYNPENETIFFYGLIGDNNTNDTITNLTVPAFGFALVVDSDTNFDNKTGCDSFNISNQSCAELTRIGNGLRDSGENLTLYDNSSQIVDNYTWHNNPGANVSMGRYPDGNNWNQNMIPTPNSPNQLTPPLEENLKLSVYLDSPIISGMSYTRLFNIEIENKDNCSKKDIVIVGYNVTDSTGDLLKESNFTRDVGCSGYADTGEWTPSETGNFTLCGFIENSTVNETDFSDNFVCENITIVESPIILLSIPAKVSFGFFNMTIVRLNTTNYEHNKTRFLIYGKNSRVVSDWNWNKITSYAECQGETSLEIDTAGNNTYFLSIPFFLYPNCDGYYHNGDYEIAIRVCNPKGSGFEKFLELYFTIQIDGKNEKLCEREKVIEYRDTYSSGSASQSSKDEYYEILFYPETVHVGEEFSSTVSLKSNATRNFTVYSYVFDGNKLLSDGFDGTAWHGKWTSNKQSVKVTPKSPTTVTLKNKIKDDALPGDYQIRIRIQDEKDLTKSITVLPRLEKEPDNHSSIELSCSESGDKVYVSIQSDVTLNASLYIFTEDGLIVKDITVTNETKKTLDAVGNYEYIQLVSDKEILADCSVTKEKSTAITGSFSEVDNHQNIFQKIYDWFKGILGFSK